MLWPRWTSQPVVRYRRTQRSVLEVAVAAAARVVLGVGWVDGVGPEVDEAEEGVEEGPSNGRHSRCSPTRGCTC